MDEKGPFAPVVVMRATWMRRVPAHLRRVLEHPAVWCFGAAFASSFVGELSTAVVTACLFEFLSQTGWSRHAAVFRSTFHNSY